VPSRVPDVVAGNLLDAARLIVGAAVAGR
jgi:hypothetical protein